MDETCGTHGGMHIEFWMGNFNVLDSLGHTHFARPFPSLM